MPRVKEGAAEEVVTPWDDPIASPIGGSMEGAEPAARVKRQPKQDDLGFVALDDTEDQINVLYYGREGTGKTTDALLMSTLPGNGRVLVINAEGGVKGVALRRRGVDTSRIVVWPPPGTKVTFDGLEAVHERVLNDLLDNPDSWAGVVVDSVTEVVAALREQATEERFDKLESQNREFDKTLIDRGDYGVMTDQLRRIFRRLRDLPCHLVLTALERTDDETKTVGPDITPALASSVLGYVDFVIYVRATQEAGESDADEGQPEFRGVTRAHTRYHAKDRFDITPVVLANPTFPRLAQYVSGDLVEANDEQQAQYNERRIARAAAAQAKLEAKAAERAARRAK